MSSIKIRDANTMTSTIVQERNAIIPNLIKKRIDSLAIKCKLSIILIMAHALHNVATKKFLTNQQSEENNVK